jgi:hypothetical protein
LTINNVYSTIIESAKVAYHLKTGQKPKKLPKTCPKQKSDAPKGWVQNIKNKTLTQI